MNGNDWSVRARSPALRTFGADLTPGGHRQELLYQWEGSRAVAGRFLTWPAHLSECGRVKRWPGGSEVVLGGSFASPISLSFPKIYKQKN